MLNFIDGKKLSSLWEISSDCVQDDHHALNNLISSDERTRNIGFMCYPPTKPPISIILECKFKIDFKMMKVSEKINFINENLFLAPLTKAFYYVF